MLNRLYAKEFTPRDEASVAMRAALENLVGCPPGKAPAPRQVGAKFKHFRRRVVGGGGRSRDAGHETARGAAPGEKNQEFGGMIEGSARLTSHSLSGSGTREFLESRPCHDLFPRAGWDV